MTHATRTSVIGIGNVSRGDDGIGIEIVRQLKQKPVPSVNYLEMDGEATRLIDAWQGYDKVILIDAMNCQKGKGGKVGAVHRFGAEGVMDADKFRASTHTFGLAEAISLSEALGKLPKQVIIFGVETGHYEYGSPITPEVLKATNEVVRLVQQELEEILCTNNP